MNNAIQLFAFEDHLVRTIMGDGGEPWFVAKDVCSVLEIANHRDVVAQLDEDEKDGVGIPDAIGREQKTTIISESGLYALVFRSRKPQARAFSKWVRKEVLPALRRTGRYAMEDATPEAMLDDLMPNLTNKERLMCLRMATQLLLSGKSVAELRSVFLQLCCLLRPAPQQVDLSDTDDLGALLRTFIDQCVEQERAAASRAGSFTRHSAIGAPITATPAPTASRLSASPSSAWACCACARYAPASSTVTSACAPVSRPALDRRRSPCLQKKGGGCWSIHRPGANPAPPSNHVRVQVSAAPVVRQNYRGRTSSSIASYTNAAGQSGEGPQLRQ